MSWWLAVFAMFTARIRPRKIILLLHGVILLLGERDNVLVAKWLLIFVISYYDLHAKSVPNWEFGIHMNLLEWRSWICSLADIRSAFVFFIYIVKHLFMPFALYTWFKSKGFINVKLIDLSDKPTSEFEVSFSMVMLIECCALCSNPNNGNDLFNVMPSLFYSFPPAKEISKS